MPDNFLRNKIKETSDFLDLDESIIEKDYYVTQLIQTLSGVENECFRLVFCGGTCLAKAHRVVRRMSEDVDFKIQKKPSTANLSKSRMLKELKIFRFELQAKLDIPHLTAKEPIVRNEGKYSHVELNYQSVFTINDNLRPQKYMNHLKVLLAHLVNRAILSIIVFLKAGLPSKL